MAILSSADTFLKSILLPAGIALVLYLSAIYIAYPLYARRRRYAAYLPLSLDGDASTSYGNSNSTGSGNGVLSRVRAGLNTVLAPLANTGVGQSVANVWEGFVSRLPLGSNRDRSVGGWDEYFGDEELDDTPGFGMPGQEAGGRGRFGEVGSERRLSRELEAGFRDDSDSEDGDEDGRGRRLR